MEVRALPQECGSSARDVRLVLFHSLALHEHHKEPKQSARAPLVLSAETLQDGLHCGIGSVYVLQELWAERPATCSHGERPVDPVLFSTSELL